MKKLFLVLTLVIISFAFLSADVYVKTKTHTSAFEMMGKKTPAKDQVLEQWIGGNKFAQISENQTIVADINESKLYVIYHGTKSYVETSLPIDLAKLLPEKTAAMLQMMKMTVTVKPNGQTKKVGDWNCKGYDINMAMGGGMMSMNMKSWASTDVPFDWKSFRDKVAPVFMKMAGSGMGMDENAMAEFKKIEGYQLAWEMKANAMGAEIETTSEVVEISKKSPPAGIYSVPQGYTKQDKLTMKRGM